MTARARIGLTQRALPPDRFGEHRDALDVRWHEFLGTCGFVAVPLPGLPEHALRGAAALGLRGLVLTGGGDLAVCGGPGGRREAAERALLRWALDTELPVLGVCRGMQLLLDEFGAELVPVDGHVATRHEITGQESEPGGARSGRGRGDGRGDGRGARREVNSYHRYAARSVPPPLVATSTHRGVVEGVRHRRAPVEGIMWHPEREASYADQDVALVRGLFGGAR
ncbi:glutamine amidotransferase-related protein [Actinomadura rupiterrae]|uniref:glutamine amidotransferase-related protein n=1 Tax=Actinomadura rupiterrae TaxID=559627 RepID=UPI0020A5749C|nr:gamma-glutamyl-gamma-aminobutyrate hydrolase family protein [Actinomadura rupiterrae]MCP2337300.1 putative glutamine amidotransferase [Actinomadura rupiterrae]